MDERVLRIIDASVNRAREGLRVVEDYARLILEDADAAQVTKTHRHAVQALADQTPYAQRLASRDIAGDVGRSIKVEAELARESSLTVLGAAFGRVQEALRSLSEFGKLVSERFAATAETLRYDVYALEQLLLSRGDRRRRLRLAGVYLLITEAACRRDWLETAEAALGAGVRCIQLREKGLSDRDLLRRAERLRERCEAHDALLLINDRPDVAKLVSADGVHLGQDDLPAPAARRVAGAERLVGVSTHTVDQADAALDLAPDYVAVGPMFASRTKPIDEIAGPQTLAVVRARTSVPIVAIGGIDATNAAAVIEAGADVIAVCSSVAGADDVERAARALVKLMQDAPSRVAT